jgi:hypothetical protein
MGLNSPLDKRQSGRSGLDAVRFHQPASEPVDEPKNRRLSAVGAVVSSIGYRIAAAAEAWRDLVGDVMASI